MSVNLKIIGMSLVVFVAVSLAVAAHGFLWGCSYDPCGPGDPHTMCMYPKGINRFMAYCMGHGARSLEMTDEMRKCTLDAHNHFRRKVAIGDTDPPQPPAANMMKLMYNMEAERVIHHWLNQCQPGHDSCRWLQNGTRAGQNLWWNSDGYDEDNMTESRHLACWHSIEKYYNEIRFLSGRTKEDIENFNMVAGTGHYTAMIWADVMSVGCAWGRGSDDSKGWYSAKPLKAGCNYVGRPNLVGGENYKVGENCTQCPEGARCSTQYPGLCTYETEEAEKADDFSSRSALLYPTLLLVLLALGFVNKLESV